MTQFSHDKAVDVTRLDFIDFPMGWALQRELGVLAPPHDPRCSSVPGHHPMSGPGFLCDCGAIQVEWRKRRRALGLSVEGAPEEGPVFDDTQRRRDLVPFSDVLREFGPDVAYREARVPAEVIQQQIKEIFAERGYVADEVRSWSRQTAENWLADNVRPSLTAIEKVEAFQRAVREGRRTGTLREVRFTVPPRIGFTHTLNDPEFPKSPLFDTLMQRQTDRIVEHRKKLDVEVKRMLDLWDHKRDGAPVLVWRKYGDIVDASLLDPKDREQHAEFADKMMLCGLASEDFPDQVLVPAVGWWPAAPIVKLVCEKEPRS